MSIASVSRATFLALSMVVSLAGCGSDAPTEPTPTDSNVAADTNDATLDSTSDSSFDSTIDSTIDVPTDSIADSAESGDAPADGVLDVALDTGPKGIGAPCTADSECLGGVCIKESTYPPYVGGYCTLRNCLSDGGTFCPAGSECLGGGGIGSTICFVRCSTTSPCRAGYKCCSSVDAGGSGICSPTSSGACL